MISILGINGGKKNGHVDRYINVCLNEAKRFGADTKNIDLTDYTILPIDKVSKNPEHLKYPEHSKDDMAKIYKEILKADGIIFGTPVNWFTTSSEMKILLDRLTSLENAGFLLEGKVAGFITHGNESGEMNALMELSAVTNHMGMFSPPYSLIYFDEHDHEWPEKDVKLLAKNIIRLVEAVQEKKINFGYEKS